MIKLNLPLRVFVSALLALVGFSAKAQTFVYTDTTFYSSNFPLGGALIRDAAGNFYGTSNTGGSYGLGTVFELVNSSGTYTQKVLYNFQGGDKDGAYPNGPLVMDAAGNLYGTTSQGGECRPVEQGCGAVFELINSSGTYTEAVLYDFTYIDGVPSGPLILDKAGNLYGTLPYGGPNSTGVVYELVNSSGTYTENVLYTFVSPNILGSKDGSHPSTGVIMDGSGNLFGTTYSGGANGAGTVFELVNSPGTYTEEILYNFADASDGAYPKAGLLLDSSGNLFGTTTLGGTNNFGVVFELVPSSGTYTENVLHSFAGAPDGNYPQAGLIMDASGNLYGTTSGELYGSPAPYGSAVVFELVHSSAAYTESVLQLYDTAGGGFGLVTPVNSSLTAIDNSGNLYGSSSASSAGAAFEITKLPVPSPPIATAIALSSTMNPAIDGESLGFTATVTPLASFPIPPGGSVAFYSGSTLLGTAVVSGNTPASVGIADAVLLGIGASTITAQYTPSGPFFAPSSTAITQTVTEAGVLLSSGNNTLNGNLTVTGALTGTFSGDGSGLLGVNALTAKTATTAGGLSCMGCVGNTQLGVNYAGSASQGGAAISALVAQNAAALGGVLAGDYARLDINNNFAGNQAIAGNLSVTGPVTIGGGTPIKEHLSMVVENPNFVAEGNTNAAMAHADCATISFPGVSDGDTVALGVPNSREAGGVIFYFAWTAGADTIKLCRAVLAAPTAKPAGAFRIDVWKH